MMIPEDKISILFNEVEEELRRATDKFGPFNSMHEGYAVILEEMDELWHEVKNNKEPDAGARARVEARQVAAMAIRFMLNLGT